MPHAPVSIEDRLQRLSDYASNHEMDLVIRWVTDNQHWEGYFGFEGGDEVFTGEFEEVIDALESEAEI